MPTPPYSDCRNPDNCACVQFGRCVAVPVPGEVIDAINRTDTDPLALVGSHYGIGEAMLIHDTGHPAEDIIRTLERMGARRDVRLSAYEIDLLLRQYRSRHDPIMVLHTHAERTLTGAKVNCLLVYCLHEGVPSLWWQVGLLNGPHGNGATMIWCATQQHRDRVLDMLRAVAGGASSEHREIVPDLPNEDDPAAGDEEDDA